MINVSSEQSNNFDNNILGNNFEVLKNVYVLKLFKYRESSFKFKEKEISWSFLMRSHK